MTAGEVRTVPEPGPALNLRTPAVGRLAQRWASSLITGGLVSGSVADLTATLRPLTLRLVRSVRTGPPDGDLARDAGLALIRHGVDGPAVIAPTVTALADGFTEELTVSPEDWPAVGVLRQRLTAVAASMAEGFAWVTREHVISGHEEVRRQLEERLRHESRHDALTGLPNRTLFFERLDALLTVPDPGRPVGICYIDLDGFKSINDGLGHAVGDRLLVAVAKRLSATVPGPGGLLARLGGDEFGILLDAGRSGVEPGEQADRVLAALAEPIVIDGRELTVSASVGVVDTVTAGTEAGGLMRAADITLYVAKARGRGRWERHDPQRGAHQEARHALATEMAGALARGEFFLEYQPLADLRAGLEGGELHRVEALVRWRHPRLGLLHPDQFIPMAEENGHIVALGRWILHAACVAAAGWHRRFPGTEVGLNVNVAVGQLYDAGLPCFVRQVLAETGLPPHLLFLELTESAVLGEAHGPVEALSALAAAGVRLVIDDFGTGYSNLLHLSRLPLSELKIAGSFLQAAPTGALVNDKIVTAIISLSHALGLSVTAEGVETEAQAARLRDLQCDTAQGWFFAMPGSADEIAARLADSGPGSG